MRKLANIELIKLLNSASFKVITGLHLGFFLLVIFATSQINITVPGFDTSNLFRFPHVWAYFAWVASWFNILLAILIIMAAGNEFSFRTFRQHVIDGLSRSDLLKGKLLVIIMISVYSFSLVFISGLIYGALYTLDFNITQIYSGIGTLFIFFLQTMAYMVIGLTLVMLLRSTALSIILFILLRFPAEPVIRSFFAPSLRPYFPMKAVGSLTPMPEFLSISSGNKFETTDSGNTLSLSEMGIIAQGLPVYLQVILAIGYSILFLGIITYIMKTRDL
jgi:ABC-2 type transport system permease protein